jgi:hypothetical protein
MATRIARWFRRRFGARRRDVFILRTEAGWEVVGRMGGAGWPEVTHYFDSEQEARAMMRLRAAVSNGPAAARAADVTEPDVTEPGVQASPEPEPVVGGVLPR